MISCSLCFSFWMQLWLLVTVKDIVRLFYNLQFWNRLHCLHISVLATWRPNNTIGRQIKESVINKLSLWFIHVQGDTKKRELLKNPTKIEEIQEKKMIDRDWSITNCLLRDSNPNYQCLKITSCRWRPPARTHSFTATTHFKSSRSFVSPCVCCMLCRMRLFRILQSMQHTQGDTKERELLKCVVAVKECIRGGGYHLPDVIFKHW